MRDCGTYASFILHYSDRSEQSDQLISARCPGTAAVLRCIVRAAGDARCPASSRAAVRTVIVSAGSTAATIAAKAATSAVPIVFYGSDYVFSPLAPSAIQ